MKRTVFLVCLLYNSVVSLASDIRSYRLPTDAIPSHYSIKIHPYIDDDTFDGEVSIYVRTKNVLGKITLHSAELNVTEAFINRIPATFQYEDDEKLSLLYSNDSIQPGEHVLHIKYTGVLLKDKGGFLKASFDYYEEEGHLLVTDFEPSDARRTFPCFDEPAFKSKFKIRLVVPDDSYTAISNMQEINRFTTSYGIVYDFATSVRMSTYLVSFAITKYPYYEEILEERDRKIPIRIYTFNASQANNQYAINCTKKAIQFYSEYTNISYPLQKLDMIEYNRAQSAATENWGLITFREGLLTLPLDIFDKLQIKTVIYHELAHFWFGNLVTNDWWNDIWLQEGFSTYMSYKLYEHETGDRKKQLQTFFFDGFTEISNKLSSRPIVDYLKTVDMLTKRFDSIVYEKAASVLSMLENIIGEEAFQKAVQKFLKSHAYKTATTNDFLSVVEEVSPQLNTRDFMESFLYQDRLPLINVNGTEGNYVLQQKGCVTSANTTASGQKWTLPITYITNVNRTETLVWFDKDKGDLTITVPGAKWILLNTNHIGIYKVTFTEEVWEDLITHFKELSLEESDSLINDAIYSFKYNIVGCEVLFNLMKNVRHKNQWLFFHGFHEFLRNGLNCNNLEKDWDIYAEFLNRRFKETDNKRGVGKSDTNCTKSEFNKQDLDKLKKCANFIENDLNLNSNDIPKN